MKTRLALWAVTAVTAITMAGVLQAALGSSGERAIHRIGAHAPAIVHFALGLSADHHHRESSRFGPATDLVANRNGQADSPTRVEAGKCCIR